jgi:hypothetical protein
VFLRPGNRTVYILDSLYIQGRSRQYPPYKTAEGAQPTTLELIVESLLKFVEMSYQLHYPGQALPVELQVRVQRWLYIRRCLNPAYPEYPPVAMLLIDTACHNRGALHVGLLI